MNNSELSRLFDAFSNGNREAFVKIYDDMKVPVYTVAYRVVKNTDTAEDITQDVFLKMFSSPITPAVKNPRAWIFQITHNASIDAIRKRNAVDNGKEDCNQEAFTDRIDMQLDLESALSRLSGEEAEIVMLHLNAGLTFDEISKISGLSLPAVYRRYKKALKTLKNVLNGGLK